MGILPTRYPDKGPHLLSLLPAAIFNKPGDEARTVEDLDGPSKYAREAEYGLKEFVYIQMERSEMMHQCGVRSISLG
jgi:hypothetical protein